MIEKIAKIDRTFLGLEDHGIWTAMLYVSYGGSGQGIGGYSLDEPMHDAEHRRRGTDYGMDWIMRCVAACGVESWEQVKGRTILVYFDDDSWGARPIGIGPLPTERGTPFMFADIAAEFGLSPSR